MSASTDMCKIDGRGIDSPMLTWVSLVALSQCRDKSGAQCIILPKEFEQKLIAYHAKRWPKSSHTIDAGESGVLKKAEAKPKERKGWSALRASRKRAKTRYDAMLFVIIFKLQTACKKLYHVRAQHWWYSQVTKRLSILPARENSKVYYSSVLSKENALIILS